MPYEVIADDRGEEHYEKYNIGILTNIWKDIFLRYRYFDVH